jgi:hypothetical protein
MLFVFLSVSFTAVSEEHEGISIAEKINSFMLVNDPQALERVNNALRTIVDMFIESYVNAKTMQGYQLNPGSVNNLRNEDYKKHAAIPEDSFYYYPLKTTRYAKQYADNFVFDELISDNKIWVSVPTNKAYYYNINTNSENYEETIRKSEKLYDEKTIEFLHDPEKIEEMAKAEINEEIIDCKIVVVNVTTIIYLKGKNTDYGIKIYSPQVNEKDPVYLENFKIYEISELLESCANYIRLSSPEALDQKPTYETEATALQNEGLLQGTGNGLDLLKPLTRIEATTILVRALGLEDEPTAEASKFEDIPDGNWGVKYANIAADKGITNGIGNNKFDPDALVTDNQFATLVLRSANEPEFDWQDAINMLIKREIITAEQAETMDLFTRGDMAKIIYESRQKSLLN